MPLELRAPNFPAYTGMRKPKGAAINDPDVWELYCLKHPEYKRPAVASNEDKLTDIPKFLEREPVAKEVA